LLDKVRERLGSEVTNLRYRAEVGDEGGGGGQAIMAGGARLIGLEDDEELERWVRSGARLVLVRLSLSSLSSFVADALLLPQYAD
jgi:bud emergence protein 1